MTEPRDEKPGYLLGLLLWLQQVAVDHMLPPMARILAVALSKFVNQNTGDAWPKQETLAAALGISIRAVARNAAQLVGRGHLEVPSRMVGQSAKAGHQTGTVRS